MWGVRRVSWESKVLEWGGNSIFWGLLSKWGVKRYLRGVYRTSLNLYIIVFLIFLKEKDESISNGIFRYNQNTKYINDYYHKFINYLEDTYRFH